jgi:hypothetical protein
MPPCLGEKAHAPTSNGLKGEWIGIIDIYHFK